MNQALSQTNAQTNGALANGSAFSQGWQKQTVQQFFSAVNWDNQPPEIQHLRIASAQEESQPLSLMLPVNQFFGAFNWDGAAAVPSMPIQPSRTETGPDDGFTLDDFSGLF